MTTKIIYHQIKKGIDCSDGIAAAWVCKRKFPDAEVIGCWYQCAEEDLPQVDADDRVFIVDFSFSADIIKRWEDLGAMITLIDHHKTAQEQLMGAIDTLSSRIIFDMAQCGAVLTWQHLFPSEPIPRFLLHIEDRDLWNFRLMYTAEIHEAMGKIGRTFEMFDLYAQCTADEFSSAIVPLGMLLLKPKRQKVSEIADRCSTQRVIFGTRDWDSTDIPTVFLSPDGSEDRYTSDVCEELYKYRYPAALFVQCITSDGTYSLRSNKNNPDGGFDVGEYARQFGGGGHRNAAGYKPAESIGERLNQRQRTFLNGPSDLSERSVRKSNE